MKSESNVCPICKQALVLEQHPNTAGVLAGWCSCRGERVIVIETKVPKKQLGNTEKGDNSKWLHQENN